MMEYHIDGFIINPFVVSMEEIHADPILKSTKILKHQEFFQNAMRRFLKGDEGMVGEVIYWLRHHSAEEGIYNYIANHTGFTLNDLVSYDSKHNEANGENNYDGPDYKLQLELWGRRSQPEEGGYCSPQETDQECVFPCAACTGNPLYSCRR